MKTSDYKDLNIWKKSMDVVTEIYRITKCFPADERYALSDQMRRSAISVPSNIAEGQSRNSAKDFIRFLYISRGSSAELRTQLEISKRLGYYDSNFVDDLIEELSQIDIMTVSLIKHLDSKSDN